MLNFLVTLGYLVIGIFAFIGLFILAYKIPWLFLSHYAKKHSMTFDGLFDEYDIFNDLTSTLNSLNYFIIVLFVADVLTVFNTLDKFSPSEVLTGVLLGSLIILCVAEIGYFFNLCSGLRRIRKHLKKQSQEQLYKQFIEQPIKF